MVNKTMIHKTIPSENDALSFSLRCSKYIKYKIYKTSSVFEMAIATNKICEWVTWAIGFLWWIDSEFASLTPSFLPLHNQWQASCYSQILITLSMSSLLFLNTWPTCPPLFVSVHFVNDKSWCKIKYVCVWGPQTAKRDSVETLVRLDQLQTTSLSTA